MLSPCRCRAPPHHRYLFLFLRRRPLARALRCPGNQYRHRRQTSRLGAGWPPPASALLAARRSTAIQSPERPATPSASSRAPCLADGVETMKAIEELKEVLQMFRGLVAVARAGRRYRRAVALEAEGRMVEALSAGEDALDLLRRPSVVRTSPPVLTLLLPATDLVATLATALGKRGSADALVTQALDVCRQTIAQEPRMSEWDHLRRHVSAFEERLRQSAEQPAHTRDLG